MKRWPTSEKQFVDISRPAVVKDYNQAMGGIDLNDQLVAIYRTDIGTKKYYLRVFQHLLDVCVVNAWLLYRCHCSQRVDEAHMTLLNFRMDVASSLIKYGKHIAKRRGRPSKAALAAETKKPKVVQATPTTDVRYDGLSHWPETANRQRCRQCNQRNHFTYFKCSKCKVPLCLTKERNCFSAKERNCFSNVNLSLTLLQSAVQRCKCYLYAYANICLKKVSLKWATIYRYLLNMFYNHRYSCLERIK